MIERSSLSETNNSVLIIAEQLRQRIPGGIGTYVVGLLDGLAQIAKDERPPIVVFTSQPNRSDDPLSRYPFPMASRRLPSRVLMQCWDRGFGAPKSQTAVVHATSLAIPPTERSLTVMVHDLAWQHVADTFPRRGRRWHEAALQRARARRAHFVTPSLATAEDLVRAGAVRDVREVHIIEHGADHLPPPDVLATTKLLESHRVFGSYLLCVGTLEPRKNLRRLFSAYKRARPLLTESSPLVVVGNKGWLEGIGDLPEGVVIIDGARDSVLSGLYQRALLLAYVPLFEGYGLPVTEAMFFDTPVLSSAVPSAGGASHLVDPYDVDSITEGLLAVANSPSLRSTLIAAGSTRVAPLTWRHTAEAHIRLWQEIADAS